MLRLRERRRPVRSLRQGLFQDLLLRRGFCQTCRAAAESQFLGVQLPIRELGEGEISWQESAQSRIGRVRFGGGSLCLSAGGATGACTAAQPRADATGPADPGAPQPTLIPISRR